MTGWTGRLEDAAYAADPRTQGRIVAPVLHRWNEDAGEYEDVELPWRYEVCPVCRGHGKHVNPAIDCMGLTQEDFDADPDFEEAYFAGQYDVTCNGCGGLRVVPALDEDRCDPDLRREYEADLADDAAYEAECRAERMMGA